MSVSTPVIILLVSLFVFQANAGQIVFGGISGGGGNIAKPEPVEYKDVHFNLRHIRPTLFMAFNEMHRRLLDSPERKANNLETLLFERSQTVFELLEGRIGIELRVNRPCQDKFGNDVDGSVHNVVNGRICISTPAFIKKSDSIKLMSDMGGLVAHEMAHLMGADEKLAEELQKVIVQKLVRLSGTVNSILASGFDNLVHSFRNKVNLNFQAFKTFDNSCVRAKYLKLALDDMYSFNFTIGGLSVMNGYQAINLRTHFQALYILIDLLCSNDMSEPTIVRAQAQKRVAIAFENDKTVEMKDAHRRLEAGRIYRGPFYPKAQKITLENSAQFVNVLNQLHEKLHRVLWYVNGIGEPIADNFKIYQNKT